LRLRIEQDLSFAFSESLKFRGGARGTLLALVSITISLIRNTGGDDAVVRADMG
jgi:hypothetical protein